LKAFSSIEPYSGAKRVPGDSLIPFAAWTGSHRLDRSANKENAMDRRIVISRGLSLVAACGVLLPRSAGADDDDDSRVSVTVSFGVGLNTAQPGNAANHHVLPDVIKVRKGGVVNFVVAGFHQIFVYSPGVKAADIPLPPAGSLFINYEQNLFYKGIAPAGGPPPGTPATANPANGGNRVESVSFAEAGDYLVICNVRPHFVDGMIATIKVR
jgi:plastocyanin